MSLFKAMGECFKPKPKYYSMIKDVYPEDGTSEPKDMSILGLYGSSNPTQLSGIGANLYEIIHKSCDSQNINTILVTLKVFDFLIHSCREIDTTYLIEHIVNSGKKINQKINNISVKAKLYETIYRSVNKLTAEQLSEFNPGIIRMINFSSKRNPFNYVCKIRALGMLTFSLIIQKNSEGFMTKLKEVIDSLIYNLRPNRNNRGKSIKAGSETKVKIIESFDQIVTEDVKREELRLMSSECFKVLGQMTTTKSIQVIIQRVFKFIDKKDLWKSKQIFEFLELVLDCDYGALVLHRLFVQIMDKDMETKEHVTSVIVELMSMFYEKNPISVTDEHEIMKFVVDLFKIHNKDDIEERRLSENLLRISQIVAQKGSNVKVNFEYVLKCLEHSTDERLVIVLGMLSNTKKIQYISSNLGISNSIFKTLVKKFSNGFLSPSFRVYFLKIFGNFKVHPKIIHKVQKSTKTKQGKNTKSIFTESQNTVLQSFLYKSLLLNDNTFYNIIYITRIFLNHIKASYPYQLPVIMHLNDTYQKSNQSFSATMKFYINTFLSTYFIALANILEVEEISTEVLEIVRLKIEEKEINGNLVNMVQNYIKVPDNRGRTKLDLLKNMFSFYNFSTEIHKKCIFRSKVLLNLIIKHETRINSQKINMTITGSIQTLNFTEAVVDEQNESEDWRMFVVDEVSDEKDDQYKVLKSIASIFDPPDTEETGSKSKLEESDLEQLKVLTERNEKDRMSFRANVEFIMERLPRTDYDDYGTTEVTYELIDDNVFNIV